jgi:O-antigen/teichoic acid export membrane protein
MLKRGIKRLLDWLRTPGESLRQRVIHGGVWVTSLNVVDRLLQITRLIVLARLLSPADFGIMGIALLSIAVIQQLSNLGLDAALIQKKENIDPFLNSVWSVKIIRGFLIFGILFATAPVIAGVFGEPRASPVLRVLGLSTVLNSLVNPAIVYFDKELEFHKQFLFTITGSVGNFVVTVVAALVLGNVWALVYGVMAAGLIKLVVSYLIDSYRPRLEIKRDAIADVVDFGKWLWATGLVVFIATQGDDAFVGWYLAAASLGLYQMAFRLSNSPATEVTHVISRVMFPAYSKLQDDAEALREAFLKTIRLVFVVTVPMSAGIVLVAPEFVRIALGEQWIPMVPAMQIMAVAGLLRAVTATGGAIFHGAGVPRYDFWMNTSRAGTILLTIWPLANMWGITGVAVSITLGIATTIPFFVYKTAEITGLSLSKYATSFAGPMLCSVVMAGAVYPVLGTSLVRLVVGISVGMAVYSGLAYMLLDVNDYWR